MGRAFCPRHCNRNQKNRITPCTIMQQSWGVSSMGAFTIIFFILQVSLPCNNAENQVTVNPIELLNYLSDQDFINGWRQSRSIWQKRGPGSEFLGKRTPGSEFLGKRVPGSEFLGKRVPGSEFLGKRRQDDPQQQEIDDLYDVMMDLTNNYHLNQRKRSSEVPLPNQQNNDRLRYESTKA